MRRAPLALLLGLAACAGAPGGAADAGTPPDQPGPYGLFTRSTTVLRDGRSIPAVAYLPQGRPGAPVVLFLPGFLLGSPMYQATVTRLATHGVAVVRADPPVNLAAVDHRAMAADARAVLDWALDPAGPLAGAVDPARVGMLGHSLGGKLAVMTAFADPRVKAVFGIDPVDAEQPDVVPTEVAPLAIPLGFAGETADARGTMPCAPEAGNYQAFYLAAAAAPWAAEWTFAGMGHQDFVDDCQGSPLCQLCQPVTGDKALGREHLHTLEVAFFRRHLGGEGSLEATLTGAAVPPGVLVRNR